MAIAWKCLSKNCYNSLKTNTLNIFLHPNRWGKEHTDLPFFARPCVCPSVCAFSIRPTILLFMYQVNMKHSFKSDIAIKPLNCYEHRNCGILVDIFQTLAVFSLIINQIKIFRILQNFGVYVLVFVGSPAQLQTVLLSGIIQLKLDRIPCQGQLLQWLFLLSKQSCPP